MQDDILNFILRHTFNISQYSVRLRRAEFGHGAVCCHKHASPFQPVITRHHANHHKVAVTVHDLRRGVKRPLRGHSQAVCSAS